MKKVILILIAISTLLLINCGGDKETKDVLKNLTDTETTYKRHIATNQSRVAKKYEDDINYSDIEDFNYVEYTYEKFNITFKVEYAIFQNCHHVNGYVIISKVTREYAYKDITYTDVYKIMPNSHSSNYISYIHIASNFNAEYIGDRTESIVTLEDEYFRSIFRTAEAMISAQLFKREKPYLGPQIRGTVTEEEVSYAAMRMRGRLEGRMIENDN